MDWFRRIVGCGCVFLERIARRHVRVSAVCALRFDKGKIFEISMFHGVCRRGYLEIRAY
jgi:hypothetical protein